MRKLKTLARGSVCLCLAALLAVPALAVEPVEAEKRREDLDFLYEEVLVKRHPNVFANTPESEFLAVKAEIEERLETESDTGFLLDLMRLTALVKDSHTCLYVGNTGQFRMYPYSLLRRGESWYLSAVAAEDEELLCQEITHLAGKPVAEVAEAFGTLFEYDNPVYLRRQFRAASNIADIYEYLGLVEAGEPLTVTLQNGESLSLEPVTMEEANQMDAAQIAGRIKGQPETAEADACYFAKALDDSTYYIQYNTCREAEDLPMEDFAAQVAEDLDAGDYGRVLLDLRYNGGGSDGVIWPLFEVLRRAMDGGVELVGLIGEQTFSSALINAVEIQEMGGVLVGEPAGGNVCHFGAIVGFTLPNSGVQGQISSKYIDLNTLLDAGAGRGAEPLEPDVEILRTLEDTLNGRDTAVDWLLAHPKRLSQKEYPDAPLTRGRFIGQIYAEFGQPSLDVALELAEPFADSFGIEWYLPALAWARAADIARGGADGTFSAARPITWKEAAVFLGRTAIARGMQFDPLIDHAGPIPAAWAQNWDQEAVTRAWDLGLLPADADFSKGLTRAQGEELAAALGARARSDIQ